MLGTFIGGAAGYRTRVQLVTDYSSTSIVQFDVLSTKKSLRLNKNTHPVLPVSVSEFHHRPVNS